MRKKGLSRRLVPTPDGKLTKLDYDLRVNCYYYVLGISNKEFLRGIRISGGNE
jgi:hypothetical protein